MLKNEQLTAIQHVYNGKDVFVWLPTGYPLLSVNATRNIGPKLPRRLACFASTVNKLAACFASSSERQKRQRYFKAILLHAEVVHFPHIFLLINCLLHISINYTENVTDLYTHAQTVDTRRSSPILQVPGYEANTCITMTTTGVGKA